MELLNLLNNYWPLIVALVGIIIVWADGRSTEKDHERRLNALETSSKDTNILLVQIQKDIVELKTLIKIHFKEIL